MKKNKKNNDTCRTILNVPNDIDEKFRELAKKRGIAKSHMILFAMGWYLDYNKSMEMMPKMFEVLSNSDELIKKER